MSATAVLDKVHTDWLAAECDTYNTTTAHSLRVVLVLLLLLCLPRSKHVFLHKHKTANRR